MEKQTRYLKELKAVLLDPKIVKKEGEKPVYFIWRGVKKFKGLRYDITEILPKLLGKEFNKTKGHYHLGNFGELYKVLKGEGIFLIQKKDLKEVYYVVAKKGQYVKVPPGYGHVTINPSLKKILKVANWVSPDCQSDYESVEKKRGFCYYYTKEGWVKNKNYKRIPPLKRKKALSQMPKNLNFLYG